MCVHNESTCPILIVLFNISSFICPLQYVSNHIRILSSLSMLIVSFSSASLALLVRFSICPLISTYSCTSAKYVSRLDCYHPPQCTSAKHVPPLHVVILLNVPPLSMFNIILNVCPLPELSAWPGACHLKKLACE
ncbi:hypothetical protein BC832DRAFT_560770 [Gaertneriomyces semiglobifer]|nr:hypothetical protein BC832DRAFT_560770 [Gaertneriomyces semiglobifer]